MVDKGKSPMCGRYLLSSPTSDIIEEYELDFEISRIEKEINHRYNISPKSQIPIILDDPDVNKRNLKLMQWGVVFNEKYGLTFNVPSENLQSSPAWKNPFLHKRCLIPATGFIEWQELEGAKKTLPWNIHKPKEEVFSLAGIWNFFPDKVTGKLELCAFIITTEANSMMRTIHNKGGNKFRQPVIIDQSNYTSWLDKNHSTPDSIFPLLKQFSVEEFAYTPLEKVGDDVKGIPPIPKDGQESKVEKKPSKKKSKKEEESLF